MFYSGRVETPVEGSATECVPHHGRLLRASRNGQLLRASRTRVGLECDRFGSRFWVRKKAASRDTTMKLLHLSPRHVLKLCGVDTG